MRAGKACRRGLGRAADRQGSADIGMRRSRQADAERSVLDFHFDAIAALLD